MKPIIDYSVYLVTDEHCLRGRNLFACIEIALRGGVSLVQYRNKNANSRTLYKEALSIKALCDYYQVPLLINDRLDIAMAVGADGVHLGQEDLPVRKARKLLGQDAIIGVSAHNIEEVQAAIAGGADYLGCGAVFATNTKADTQVIGTQMLREIKKVTTIPFVGIGGISLLNYAEVLQAGADGAAIVSGILGAEDIKWTTHKFRVQATTIKKA